MAYEFGWLANLSLNLQKVFSKKSKKININILNKFIIQYEYIFIITNLEQSVGSFFNLNSFPIFLKNKKTGKEIFLTVMLRKFITIREKLETIDIDLRKLCSEKNLTIEDISWDYQRLSSLENSLEEIADLLNKEDWDLDGYIFYNPQTIEVELNPIWFNFLQQNVFWDLEKNMTQVEIYLRKPNPKVENIYRQYLDFLNFLYFLKNQNVSDTYKKVRVQSYLDKAFELTERFGDIHGEAKLLQDDLDLLKE